MSAAPSFVLETARQTLRQFAEGDAPLLFALDSDPEVRRYTPDPAPESLEAVRASVAKYQDVYAEDGFARWICFERRTQEFLGWCGLRRQPDGEVDLGYRYRRSAWGRGFATEAASACLEYGFTVLALPRIIATAYAANGASRRILEKLAMRAEREETQHGATVVVYALDRDDFLRFPTPS